MSVRSAFCHGCALAWLAAAPLALAADDTAKGRPTPIIFSAPKSDTVSSNLNQIGSKSSSLRDLESGLKKPFEIFENGRSPGFQPPNQFTPSTPNPPAMNRRLKETLDKRAEDSYLLSEDDESQLSPEGLISPDRESVDPVTGRPKTSLDRYYDRIDRSRTGPTNQTSRSLDLLDKQDSLEAKETWKLGKTASFFDSEITPKGYNSGRMSNSISGGSRLSSERTKPRSFGDAFELGPVESVQQSGRTRETRLEEFKRLLDGPSYGGANGFSPTPSLGAAYQLPKPTAAPGSESSLAVGSQSPGSWYGNTTTTPGFSGTVGVPKGLPEYTASTPSLTTTPSVPQQPAQQPPVPSFKIPRGRF